MRSILLATVLVSAAALAPAHAQDDKAKKWCTDAHMQQMADDIAKMSDAAKKKEADTHLAMSKAAMQSNDLKGCVAHMEETHKAMGM
jgi:hypothetical protein